MKSNSNQGMAGVSRRDFIKASAALAAAGIGTSRLYAAGSDKIRVGLIGCGGRGNGALDNHLAACKHIGKDAQVVATADWFKGRAEGTGKRHGVPAEKCFAGATAYKDLLATDVDVVLIATSPNFRPVHFEAAVNAGKNVFMEKPVAVDPPGARRIIASGEVAKDKGLAVVAGTQRRHERGYQRQAYEIENGAKGKITGGRVSWCGGALWFQRQNENESDADYMIRNWVSFTEMSGDHIVEQHVHNLDVANWFIGRPPVTALGFGGRARRKTGNQFDFHSVDFDWGDGVHIHSMCRQINGTHGGVWENFVYSGSDKKVDVPDFEEHGGPYVQEHVDLLRSILAGKPLNEARNVAISTMTAIMGRIATYTGVTVKWDDLIKNKDSRWYNLTLKPTAEDFEKGPVTAPEDDVCAIPGKD
ncbi:MAG: Gfo/Idh/MocA family oxidoreductase [Sedimentisphaerales bacterium]|nr:Gfo/Idh/MocA family oxidoreductase [Sedimentisphaerales bacterium]